jgi:solute carrier family 25 citrate transporter 1
MQLNPELNKMGALNVVRKTYADAGLVGFYRGYPALLMFSIPKNSVRFGVYDWASKNLFTEKKKSHNFCCGLTAGAAEAIAVVTPQETLKTRLIHDRLSAEPKYRNVFHGIYTISSQQGPSGLYKGVLATILKQSTN